jgi:hypothetical protein
VVQLPGELQRQVTAEADAKDIAQQKQGQVVIGRGFALERAFSPIEALKGGKEVFHRIAGSGSKRRAHGKLNWSWYRNEHSAGQFRRRLIEYCRPRISRVVGMISNLQALLQRF